MPRELLLLSNILEHPGAFDFIRQARRRNPAITFLVTGDLLNVFPEPGEELEQSIFHEVHGGDLIRREIDRLVSTRFRGAADSPLVGPLREMFLPTGSRFEAARDIARHRYRRFFQSLHAALGTSDLYFIPGNMDYPDLALVGSAASRRIHMVDQVTFSLGRFTVGALGGIPNTSHPFRGVVEISPYEMSEVEYERRLRALEGVDILVTHQSPAEYPPLADFVRRTRLQMLVCRAPFDFSSTGDHRGKLQMYAMDSKHIVEVRPFDFPVNAAIVLRLGEGPLSNDDVRIERIRVRARRPDLEMRAP